MLHDEPFSALDTTTLYALLKLRADVFVVEQACAYPDLDGLDREPGTRHVWWDEGAGPVAYLRVLALPDGSRRIGRVATATAARRRGLAERLVRYVVDEKATGGPILLDAQAHLEAVVSPFALRADRAGVHRGRDSSRPHAPGALIPAPDCAYGRGRCCCCPQGGRRPLRVPLWEPRRRWRSADERLGCSGLVGREGA